MASSPKPIRSQTGASVLPIAIGASILLHAGLGVIIGLQASRSDSADADTRFAHFQTLEDPEELRPVTLGNPDSRASSLTWIGYEEFEEMWAKESEIDQAAQNPEEPGTPVETEEVVPDPDDQPLLAEPQPTPTQSEEEPATEQDEQLVLVTPEEAPAAEIEGPQAEIDYAQLIEMIDAIEGLAADLPRFNPVRALVDRQAARNAAQTAAPDADELANPNQTEANAENSPNPAKPPVPGDSGDRAERESDAAAVKPVKNDDLGKPLAAQGLNIRTVRPTFSNVTLATARPRNPVAQIDFRRNGKPIRVSIIRSSGHEQVDLDIRKALYSWRASGETLLQLPEPENPENPAFISIKLEILL